MSEEIKILFKKYKVRIPKEKQGQSECIICKENHKYSLTWTSFLYEYEGHYYCYEHIINILLQQENKQLKEDKKKAIEYIEENCYKKMGGYGDNEDDDIEVCLFEDDIWELKEILGDKENE